jgi:hypothetical protein
MIDLTLAAPGSGFTLVMGGVASDVGHLEATNQ